MMNISELLIGIAIGDAFGAGVEFQDRDWIREKVDFSCFVNARAMISVPEHQKSLFTTNYTPWDYTDDTEMTIGLLKALMAPEPFSEALLIQKWEEEYNKGIFEKGYGRNGHGSMSWYFSGEKTIKEIQNFQRDRANPGNAPAMRAVPLGLIHPDLINSYAAINANATHPNINAILASQCIARASEFLLIKKGDPAQLVNYCLQTIAFNEEYKAYLIAVDALGVYEKLQPSDFNILCGEQPIQAPYFLPGIKGVPSDSKYTAGAVLYVLKHSTSAFDALQKSIYLGGDVDSIAAITTGILAGSMGLDSLPSFMLEQVEGLSYLKELARQFAPKN
ncbi:ADP-ribosylglycohydrolase family protein [Aureispira anguillae]|uniref:ADP-ribosylglycohydrolase family protein n=1 Tax=Aureispira anguillae TaxID=2864201 RepID=A0A915YKA3_9BACT|nr:ADP-ribosylglycohydrolase family protein [Aureispira anguillae]BDS14774.1 ADP-ribosylglycohydrolase family protein [Aureispira anguillae]